MAAISSPFVAGFCYNKSNFEQINPSSRLTVKPRRVLAVRAEAQAINPDIRKSEDKVVDSVPVNELAKPLTAYCRLALNENSKNHLLSLYFNGLKIHDEFQSSISQHKNWNLQLNMDTDKSGQYDEILTSGSDFMELVHAHKEALLPLDSKQAGTPSENESTKEYYGGQDQENKDSQYGKSDEIDVPKRQIIQEEEREKGRVGFGVYWKYITTAYGGACVPLILLAEILNQIFQISSNYWMAWATPESKDVKPVTSESTLILVYVVFSIGSSLCLLVRITLLVTAGYKTATRLFNKMHFCIFRAPMSFFDATPSGRILNRASTDQSEVDLQIAYQVGTVVFMLSQLLGIIGVMSQVAWKIFVILIPVCLICIWYQKYYIPAARELSRLVGVCKAPIFQHFAETISGSTTIRSFDLQARFQERNMKLIDEFCRPKFHIIGAMEWLCFRLDMFSCVTFAVSLIFIISFRERIDPTIAGLAVTYGLNLNNLQTWLLWKMCNMENQIISVERILQYMSIPSEPPLIIEGHRPDHFWPSHGEVVIDNLQKNTTIFTKLTLPIVF